MKLPISKRLLACVSFIRPGERVADVGTDHGYLAIYLLQKRIAARVLAADIGPQPLENARNNARRFGVEKGISFHLCDGVRGLPREFDVLVMAGMGADTMVGILRSGPWLRRNGCRLVLQCQSSQNELRQYLSESGWTITREKPVKDGRFLYTVLEAVPGEMRLTPGQHFASPALLCGTDPLVKDYLAFCCRMVEKVVIGLEVQGGEKYEFYCAALRELREMEAAR